MVTLACYIDVCTGGATIILGSADLHYNSTDMTGSTDTTVITDITDVTDMTSVLILPAQSLLPLSCFP